eukprot:SAG11_NODE_2584_length_3195_cov_2.145026_6_plen_97_part_01
MRLVERSTLRHSTPEFDPALSANSAIALRIAGVPDEADARGLGGVVHAAADALGLGAPGAEARRPRRRVSPPRIERDGARGRQQRGRSEPRAGRAAA